jgi:hypothetical protein
VNRNSDGIGSTAQPTRAAEFCGRDADGGCNDPTGFLIAALTGLWWRNSRAGQRGRRHASYLNDIGNEAAFKVGASTRSASVWR